MLAGLFAPRGSGEEIDAISRYQRHAASADVASAFLELDLVSDPRETARLTMPTLVLHRRGDHAVTSAAAASSPRWSRTRFRGALRATHLPWMDDRREVQRLCFPATAPGRGQRRLAASRRETDVLPRRLGSLEP
jgi:pimeloyl-ACP methyl ester carboxylesterase